MRPARRVSYFKFELACRALATVMRELQRHPWYGTRAARTGAETVELFGNKSIVWSIGKWDAVKSIRWHGPGKSA
jgi:hypothetical protein